MNQLTLTEEQRRGVRASILVVMLVLVLFVLVLVAGRPIMDFGNEPLSIAYTVVIYIPVMALCLLAYRRLRRS
jgi:di/tricarboxylate transporter